MSTETQEIIRTLEQLPESKRIEVVDFARFLLAQQADEHWEQIVADPGQRPKLDEFLEQSRAEGSEPMDTGRL